MMNIDFTVAIPTYNGESKLPQVIERLQNQEAVEAINWEIIVVDNNSRDRTGELIRAYQKQWKHPFPLRYCFEIQQGLAFARARAIQEAQGEIIGFLDDDNLAAPNWISEAYKFILENPRVGACASQIHGAFEVAPPENLKPILFYLAITERGEKPHLYQPRRGVPPGAGLVVRRQVWKDNVPVNLFFIGRVSSSMVGSEDAEALLYIQNAGWEIWYNPAMEIEHVIPASRLEKKYLISLLRSIGLARHHLRMLQLKLWQRPFAFFAYLISDTLKSMGYFIHNRHLINEDVVTACEMERLIATTISPFYLAKLRIQRFWQNKRSPN